MVSCPRCAQQVDETTRTTCPHCFTPLSATGAPPTGQPPPGPPASGMPGQPPPPQSYAPQLNRSAGTRVSLTGEVIEDNASAPPPSYVGGGAPVRPPVGVAPRPGPPAASRAAYGASRTEAPAKSGGGKAVGILLGLLIVGGLGTAGWFFLMPHTNPKEVVQKFDTAVAAQAWKAAYPLVELSSDMKTKCPDASAFAGYMTSEVDKMRAVPMANAIVDAALKSYQTAKVGEPTIDGDSAKVPVSLRLSISGMGTTIERPVDMNVPLRKVGGTWKIDGIKNAVPGGIGG